MSAKKPAKKKKAPPKRKQGRPTAYKPEFNEQVRKFAAKGATLPEIADFYNVAPSTISLWMVTHEGFSEAIKLARDVSDARVEQSLFDRATGYSHKATKMALDRDGEWRTMEYTEHYPPDPTSMIFWLKNRQPEKWREKMEIEGGLTIKVEAPGGEDPAPA